MDDNLGRFVAILGLAMIVAICARKLRLPFTIGLVFSGIGLAFTKPDFGTHLTHDLLFDMILPPLLFEAALSLSWQELIIDAGPLFALAGVGTLISAGVVALATINILEWPAPSALVFAALIAATDPVAIIAMFKDNKIQGRLRLLVESESLLNDGVAAVLFVVALAWAQSDGAYQNYRELIFMIMRIMFGGVIVGVFVGVFAILLSFRTDEHVIEAALTTIAAYGAFLLAEHFQVSGVLATVSAGLMIGNFGLGSETGSSFLSKKGQEFIHGFWEFAAFIANSIVFLLIGVDVASTPFTHYSLTLLGQIILIVLVARAMAVYPLSALFLRSSRRINLREQHVLWWGGLRGALAIALALSLPSDLPMRDMLLTSTFAVVAFSIIAQGLTMPLLLRKLNFLPESHVGK
jgi:monovalent cation:H+ antiporter, CPA1 family